MSTLSELCLPLVKVGGLFIALKGPKADEEVKNAENALKILGGEVIEMDALDLEGNERVNVIVKKVRSCKKTYPRGQNLPKRKPL